MLYFANTPQSWGSSPNTADEALRNAKANFRDQFRANKTPHYVLVFPTGTEITINAWGGWSSDKHPTGVVIARNLDEETLNDLNAMVARGQEAHS